MKQAKDNDDDYSLRGKQCNQKAMLNQMLMQSHTQSIDESAKYALEDPSIYQYDEVYDDMKNTRETLQEKKKEEKKKKNSSIIASIREAKFRKDRESSISTELLAKRDRIRNGHVDEEEQFVTSSYKKVIEENRQFENEQKKRDKEIEMRSVQGKGNMGDFNKGLFNAGFFQGGDRVDINQASKEIKQEEYIQKMLKIKQERMQKQSEIDAHYKKDLREQYELDRLQKEQLDAKQSNNQNDDGIQQEQQISRNSKSKSIERSKKKRKYSRSRSKDRKKDKKKDKKHKKHHYSSRSRSRSKSHEKKHSKKNRKQSSSKEQKLNKQPEKEEIAMEQKKKSRPLVPVFSSDQGMQKQSEMDQQKQEEKQVLTPEEKKKQLLERFKQRKEKQKLQEQLEQQQQQQQK